MTVKLNRRGALLSGGAMAIGGSVLAEAPIDLGERLDLGYRSGLLEGLHAVLALRDGETVLESYFAGVDENWGRALGEVRFDADTLHDLRSVTKSVTSLLYGIALEKGLVPPPEAALMEAFPQYPDLAVDPARAGWQVAHALNMTLGIEWNEDLPYSDPRNSEIAMEFAEDRYRFILEQPIVTEAGAVWRYNGGCSALIGYLIETGTGQSLSEFATEHLFEPLGIARFDWNAGADGVQSAASGLRLTARDLARIGEMILAEGQVDGTRVVPASWLERCRTWQANGPFGLGYSHQWYLSEQFSGAEMHFTLSGMGNGGQRLFVIPSLKLVVVTYSGNYNRMDQWMNPTLVLQRIILA